MGGDGSGWVPLPTIHVEPHREDASNPETPAWANFDARRQNSVGRNPSALTMRAVPPSTWIR